jgi:threonine dehydratase
MESHSQNSAATVSLAGIQAARDIIYQTMQPSLMAEYPLLNEALGARAMVKHENHLPTGAFKIRGGLNFMHHFVAEATHHGVIGATRGNHGQSIALAAQRYDIPATIVVPHGNNPEKNAAMRAYGARLVEHGEDFAAACGEADRLAAAENLRFIHSANEPHLINGVGTYALEIIETAQARGETIDAVLVPIGMGSGLCGVITAFRALSPTTKIYGVQATGAPSVYLSWQAGHIVTTETANTFADGMATRLPAEMTFDIIKRGVDEIVLVSDDEIAEAIRLLWRTTHNLVEGAGAAATAAAWQLRDQLRGKNVVHVLSGANLDSETLGKIFTS